MKVCTDVCLFGAWIAEKIQSGNVKIEKVLDIGTGTGLLSLMIAQKSEADIDAVEIDALAAEQAKENFESSAWKERLRIIEGDARHFVSDNQYDLIISNPPFFENDLKSEDQKRNVALHGEALKFEELNLKAAELLSPNGCFAVMLPYFRSDAFIKFSIENRFFLQEKVFVKQTEKHSYFRTMLLFSKEPAQEQQSEITIKKGGAYSAEFIELLKDYYLYL